MPALVVDIETVSSDISMLDPVTQETLMKKITAEKGSEAYQQEYDRIMGELVFSPLTGIIVAIGGYDVSREKGVVYFQSPEEEGEDFEEGGIVYKRTTEKEMLESFWAGMRNFDEVVTFNGKGFDLPYMMIRSAIHGIRPTKNLMSHRYLGSQNYAARHVDLQDELSFYGATRKQSLHMWCQACGIESPKIEGIAGDAVGRLYKDKKYTDIARYNGRDIIATARLYQWWQQYLRFDK